MNGLSEHISGFERLLRSVEGRSEMTIKSYRAKVEEFFKWFRENRSISQVQISNIVRQDIESYLEYCYYQNNKNQTRLTKLIALRRFFRYLVYEEVIKDDITLHIHRPKISRRGIQIFTKEEILKLFSVMDPTMEKGLRDINILILGVFCGLRISEIINVNLSDIIDDGSVISINVVGKFDSPRTVDLWKAPSMFTRQWLATRISQCAGKEAPLFIAYKKGDNASDSRLTPPGIDRLLKRYSEHAGIRKQIVTMHMLRATHATNLRYIKGYDIYAIRDRLGHKNISTTEQYVSAHGRKSREYPSLYIYWRDFNHVWEERIEN